MTWPVGNLFGSNAFNMIILLFADAAYTRGPILTGAAWGQVVAGVGAIGLMAVRWPPSSTRGDEDQPAGARCPGPAAVLRRGALCGVATTA